MCSIRILIVEMEAVIKVSDGHSLVTDLYSHHYLIVVGDHRPEIELLARVFDLEIEQI